MNLSRARIAPSMFLLIAAPLLFAQDDSSTGASASNRLPYEVIITPTIKRSDIRKLIVQVEDDFFKKFNELNIDDNYDILCYEMIPIMSHIPQRVCEPHFMMEARGANASEVAFGFGGPPGSGGAAPHGNLLPPKGMRNEVAHEYDTLQEKMESFNASNLELRSIGKALATLKARLANFSKDQND